MTWAHVQERIDHKVAKPNMPYRAMLARLQEKLSNTHNSKQRQQIETDMVIITGIIEAQAKLDSIIKELEKRLL